MESIVEPAAWMVLGIVVGWLALFVIRATPWLRRREQRRIEKERDERIKETWFYGPSSS